MVKKREMYGLNILRAISCIAVFLYHLNILKGGYLAVSIFFTLTGYLTCTSLIKKKDFSLKEYYITRFKRIYLPLLIVVLSSIGIIYFIKDFAWINLKSETISVLFGYNNFWQLNANLDYFTKQTMSPFIHFWYISIIIQFNVVFPLLFYFFKKCKLKSKKNIVAMLLIILSLFSYLYFVYLNTFNIMNAYYNTFSRLFSILLGCFIAIINNKKSLIIKKNNLIIQMIYYILLFVLFIFTSTSSKYISFYMLFTTVFSLRIIEYSINYKFNCNNYFIKIMNKISDISYEVYLIQYPIIFIFMFLDISNVIKILLIIFITFTISYLLHSIFVSNLKIKEKILICFFAFISSFGCGIFIASKNYSKEIDNLKKQLSENEKLLNQSQIEYMKNKQEEESKWNELLQSYDNMTIEVDNFIKELQIVAIGDSVMLGAIDELQLKFPNGYYDAKISRTAWVINSILLNLKNNNKLNGPIIIHLGTNGDCAECRKTIMETCKDNEVFWLNITNDRSIGFNSNLNEFAKKYDNLHVVNWEEYSKNHSEYFVTDKIHLTENGKKAYTNLIYETLYNYYINKIQIEKENIIKQHNEEENNKITFIGNDLLINIINLLNSNYNNANYIMDSNFNYQSIVEKIENTKNNNELNKRVLLAFDKSTNLTKKDYEYIISLLDGYEVYVLDTNNFVDDNNIKRIDILNIMNDNVYIDNIHLTEEGNQKLFQKIKESLN